MEAPDLQLVSQKCRGQSGQVAAAEFGWGGSLVGLSPLPLGSV